MKPLQLVIPIFYCFVVVQLSAQNKTHIISGKPAVKWEEAMISGNGSTGVMVYGNPNAETIIVNHEKCWVPTSNIARKVAHLKVPIQKARKKVAKGKLGAPTISLYDAFSNWNIKNYPHESLVSKYRSVYANSGRDNVHPAFQIKWTADNKLPYTNYKRETVLDNGEVNVYWTNVHSSWERNIFVSRPDNVIIWRMRSKKNKKINGLISLAEIKGGSSEYIENVKIDYSNNQLYFYSNYSNSWGKLIKEGYHALGKIKNKGGQLIQTEEGIQIQDADEVLLIMRFEFLDDINKVNRQSLAFSVNNIKSNYNTLLKRHANIHGEMLRRVQVDFGGNHGVGRKTETILAEATKKGMTPELMELLHDLGRYALISSSGEFPPTLMGIWGGSWKPAWGGHYTFDSNLQLAVSAAAIGNLPEASESYFNLIKTMYDDWKINATNLYGSRGYLASMGSSWRKESGLSGGSWFAITDGAGWLSAYFDEHYLCTGDKVFLKNTQIPLLKNIALFYEDYLKGTENANGKYLFYPSISPENRPDKLPGTDLRSYITPNATSEIVICEYVLTKLIQYCNELGIEQENIATWESMLKKLPEYRINKDGALHEWSYPGIEGNYGNKSSVQFFGLYPGLGVDKIKTPKMFKAIDRGLQLRAETGLSKISGHGLLHDCFFMSRLKRENYFWEKIDVFAKQNFFYNSLLSSHFTNRGIYNLDTTLAFPAVIMEMLVSSKPGIIELLPVVTKTRLPKGNIKGMLARNGITIENLSWDLQEGTIEVQLNSKTDQIINLSVPKPIKSIIATNGLKKITNSDYGLDWRSLKLKANQSELFKIKI